MDNFVYGLGVMTLGGLDVVGAADVLELVVMPDHVIVQAVSILVDFQADGCIGGNTWNLYCMANNGLVVDLRNFNQVFHIHFVELYVIEIGVASGITEFRGEIVGVFGL